MTLVITFVVACDQLTKSWAQAALSHRSIDLVGPIRFTLFYNTGFAFSLGVGHPVVIGVVSGIVAVGIIWYALHARYRGSAVAASLLAGGAIGNLWDRVFRHNHGAVIDFIAFPHWPIFNLSDAAVTIGIALLAVAGLRDRL
ncbi:MAG: signal peptidase II [Ferrimicrobium sp.]